MAAIDKKMTKVVGVMYLEDKYSVAMISEKLGFSVNQIQYCLKKNNIPRRNRSEATNLAYFYRFNKLPCNIRKKFTPQQRELLITGIMLYWAEGWKKNSTYVSFTNSDPQMVVLFAKFLREICGVQESRLRLKLHLYNDQNEKILKNFWANITDIPLYQFNATYFHEGKSGTYKKKSKYGTICLCYADKKLLNQILKWIDQYLLELNIAMPR